MEETEEKMSQIITDCLEQACQQWQEEFHCDKETALMAFGRGDMQIVAEIRPFGNFRLKPVLDTMGTVIGATAFPVGTQGE